ncbi:MAG: hypothetical protein EHM49_10305, partial [Deltaproteobacteria bacterium]
MAKGDKSDRNILEQNLSDPSRIIWPENPEELTEARNKILNLVPAKQKTLLDLSLLTHILVNHHSSLSSDLFSWAQKNLNPASLLSGIQWNEIVKCRWQALPIAVIQGEKSSTLFWVVGCISPANAVSAKFPTWSEKFLDESASKGIEETLSIVRAQYPAGDSCALYLYPIISSSETHPPVRERSLCLPIALGAIAAITGQTMFPGLLATGDVCVKGDQVQIGAVGWVLEKAKLALNENFSL